MKDYVLPAQLNLYQTCNGDLDRVYGEAMNGNGYDTEDLRGHKESSRFAPVGAIRTSPGRAAPLLMTSTGLEGFEAFTVTENVEIERSLSHRHFLRTVLRTV